MQSQIPTTEYNALVGFYSNTHGGTWFSNTGWLNPQAASWYGVTVSNGHVVSLDLQFNNLSNSLTGTLIDFSYLTTVNLSSNHLTGLIPSNLGELTDLTDLNLAHNGFSGAIPSELGSSPHLQQLSLAGNKLDSGIPTTLTNLAYLGLLDLHSNQLSGAIPARLSNLSLLTNLDLGSNKLSGGIPTNVDSLSNLTFLNLANNTLGGSIPTNVGNLAQLQFLRLDSASLTGSIPINLAGLTNLQTLELAKNNLTNGVPTNFDNLSALLELDLSSNQLGGSIPTNLGNLSPLLVLRLADDGLTNGIPANLGTLVNLQEINLDNNALSNTIPTNFSALTQLHALRLHNDDLTGSILTNLNLMPQLQDLDLGGNQLTNIIPTNLDNLTNLTNFNLSGNQLSGGIPTNLGGLTNLQNFALDNNQLTNGIPANLGGFIQLVNLDLSSNQLNGAIPAELGNLVQLTNLDLSTNQLSGGAPSSLTNLLLLRNLNLSSNSLDGGIPTGLSALSHLTELDLAANQLNGGIPSSLGYLYKLKDLELQSNQLSGDIPYFIAFSTVNINIAYNDLNVSAGSESLADIDAMIAASNTIEYLPQLDLSIITQPLDQLAATGHVATFTITATGAPPLYYQWQFDGVDIAEATNSALTLNSVTASNVGFYSVVISNAYDVLTSDSAGLDIETSGVSHPLLAITSPASGSHTSVGVEGVVKDSKLPIWSVFYTLSNINDRVTVTQGQAVLTSGNGTVSNWFVTNGILPGTNFIFVQAFDTTSNHSALIKQRFFYDSTAPLDIVTQGTGSGAIAIHSFTSGEEPETNALNIGQTYKITARPAAGSLFGGWLVATPGKPIFTYKTSIDFQMESDLTLTVDFETNIFLGTYGSYNGIFTISNDPANATETTAGMLGNLKIESNGAYSGRVFFDGTARAISGVMDAYGKATNHIAGQTIAATMEMNLDFTNIPPEIDGSVAGTNDHVAWSAALAAERATPFSPGQYTILVPPATNSPQDSPGGYGYLTITNREGTTKNPGAVTITGALADGTTFSETTAAAISGNVPLYANLYNHAGLLLGWINLTNFSIDEMTWTHPMTLHGLYRAGFTNMVASNVLFSPWTNLGSGLLGLTNISDLTNLFFTNTEYETNLTDANVVAIEDNFHITGEAVNGELHPQTGIFTVTLGSGNDRSIGHGVILMNTNFGGGYFVTSTNAQAVILQP